jgi:hypothetical protein
VKTDPKKTEAINKFKKPTNINELRSFLGLVNYCRSFIPNLAKLSIPLNNMLKGESKRSVRKIKWDDNLKNIKDVKKCLSINTKRAQPDFSKTFILTTNASEHSIGGVLSQKDDHNNEFMVYAYSKAMD